MESSEVKPKVFLDKLAIPTIEYKSMAACLERNKESQSRRADRRDKLRWDEGVFRRTLLLPCERGFHSCLSAACVFQRRREEEYIYRGRGRVVPLRRKTPATKLEQKTSFGRAWMRA